MKLASEIAAAFGGTNMPINAKRRPLTKEEITAELEQRELNDAREFQERSILLAEIFPDKFKAPNLFDDLDVPDIFK